MPTLPGVGPIHLGDTRFSFHRPKDGALTRHRLSAIGKAVETFLFTESFAHCHIRHLESSARTLQFRFIAGENFVKGIAVFSKTSFVRLCHRDALFPPHTLHMI